MQCFDVRPQAITWRGDGETLVVQAWGADSLRVRSARCHDVIDTRFALLEPAETTPEICVDGDTATITNGRITAILRASAFHADARGYLAVSASIEFRNQRGETLLREAPRGGSLHIDARAFRPIPGGEHALTASFVSPVSERLAGMGQYQQDIANLKGCTFELAHRNSQVSIPFVLSSAGYGFLWHNPAIGRATFGLNRTEWHAESTRQLDYWITAGDTPAQITASYADATGHVPAMPEHGLGYWQCKLRYWNQAQLLGVAREHKRRGLPLDVIVADFFHWPHMGDFRFDEEFWPDPAAMAAELKELGVELMVSVWPQVSISSENYAEFKHRNMLVKAERGMDIHMAFGAPSAFLDVTNPAARARLWELCKKNYHDLGVRLFWLDEAEPEYGVYDFDNYRYHAGPNVQIGNIYPQLFARGIYEGQRSAGQSQIVNLLRCAWAGSQRYGALVWSGDIHSTYADLRRQITAAIHMGVAGIPWFTTDIGGFHNGDIEDPDFRDLLIRWFQFGAFCPVMRMHGDRRPYEAVTGKDGTARIRSGAPNELWSFGEDVYEILVRYVRVREAMRPYLRAVMDDAHRRGQPVVRGLFHEFPRDEPCWDVADQYMFGPDLLVAPVVAPHATRRSLYLPEGSTWTNLHTGERLRGGLRVECDAPASVIPVFGRDTLATMPRWFA